MRLLRLGYRWAWPWWVAWEAVPEAGDSATVSDAPGPRAFRCDLCVTAGVLVNRVAVQRRIPLLMRSFGAHVPGGPPSLLEVSAVQERVWPAGSVGGQLTTESMEHGYQAVQLDVSVTIVDWPVVHAWTEDDPGFVGEVSVTNEVGVPLVSMVWPAPTDLAADWSLDQGGWRRVGAWGWDWAGRRVAPVAGASSPGVKE